MPRFTPAFAGIVTVALVLASRRMGVTHYPALGSSDFPHAARVAPLDARPSGRLADRSILADGLARPVADEVGRFERGPVEWVWNLSYRALAREH